MLTKYEKYSDESIVRISKFVRNNLGQGRAVARLKNPNTGIFTEVQVVFKSHSSAKRTVHPAIGNTHLFPLQHSVSRRNGQQGD